MPHSFVQWTAIFGIIAVAILFLTEVGKWRLLGRILNRKHQILRIWLVILIETLFVMMYIGPWVTNRKDPITELLYWTICILVGLVVVIFSLLDLRGVAKEYSSFNRRMFGSQRGDGQQDK